MCYIINIQNNTNVKGVNMKVIANISYLDKELNRQVAEGEVLEVTEERGKVLTTNQFNNVFYCSVVEEAKAEKPPVKRKRK